MHFNVKVRISDTGESYFFFENFFLRAGSLPQLALHAVSLVCGVVFGLPGTSKGKCLCLDHEPEVCFPSS